MELQWFRNGDLVDLKEENRLYRSSLCVQPITKEENGVIFTCQLKGDASVNSSVELDVQCKFYLCTKMNQKIEFTKKISLEISSSTNQFYANSLF